MSSIKNQIIPDEQFSKLLDIIYSYLLKQGWNRVAAKATLEEGRVYPEQSLLAHSINALSIIHRILSFLNQRGYKKVTKELYTKALIVSLLHDIGKVKKIKGHIKETKLEDIQNLLDEIIKFMKVDVSSETPEINRLLNQLEEISSKSLDEIYETIKEHQGLDASALLAGKRGALSKDFYDLYNLVLLGDVLAYYRDETDIIRIKRLVNRLLYRLTGKEDFKLTYYRITKLHGVITQFIHAFIEEYFAENFTNMVPILYSADRTFFLLDGDAHVDLDALVEFIVSKLEDKLRELITRRNIKNTLLIDNDKKYGLSIDPFLLLFGNLDRIMEHAGNFYFELSNRVTENTKRSNIKKIAKVNKDYGLNLDEDYSVTLISRMLKFYYRFSQDAAFLKRKDKNERPKVLTQILFDLVGLNVDELPSEVFNSKDLDLIVAGYLFNAEVDGKLLKEYSNPFIIVGQLLAKALNTINEQHLKLKSDENIFQMYFKKQIGLSYTAYINELKQRVSDILILDFTLVKSVDSLIQSPEHYIVAKAEGSSGSNFKKKYVCVLCNLNGFGFPLKTQRSSLSTRIFTNRNIASAGLNVRWICALCLLESIFRAIVLEQKIGSDAKKIYIFMLPDVLYTRMFAMTIYRKVSSLFSESFQFFNIQGFSNMIFSGETPEVRNLFRAAQNRGVAPLKTVDAHYIMFMGLYPPIDNRSVPDSYIWFETLCITLTLQRLFGGKYIITESFAPPSFRSIYTILLDGPHSYIRRLLEIAKVSGISDANELSLLELSRIEELLASILIVGDTRDIDNTLRPQQEVPRALKTFLDYRLPGSKFFAETLAYAKTKNRDHIVRRKDEFLKACKILDVIKEGGMLIEW